MTDAERQSPNIVTLNDLGEDATPDERAKQQSQLEALAASLKKSLLILTTTSVDKRRKFERLFCLLGYGNDPAATELGVDVQFTHSGALKMVPTRTPELTQSYGGNLEEKAEQQYFTLIENKKNIQKQMADDKNFDPAKVVGMTEDSGWHIVIKSDLQREKFIGEVQRLVSQKIDKKYEALLGNLSQGIKDKDGNVDFPGPNLHPLQEALYGMSGLMDVIYEAARNVDKVVNIASIPKLSDGLRYVNVSHVAFAVPPEAEGEKGTIYCKDFRATGRLLTEAEYKEKRDRVRRGELFVSLNSDSVHVPDRIGDTRDSPRRNDTYADLGDDSILVTSSDDSSVESTKSVQHVRRAIAEFLQEQVVGKRNILENANAVERGEFGIGWVSPELPQGTAPGIRGAAIDPDIQGAFNGKMKTSDIPSDDALLQSPEKAPFNHSDAVVFRANALQRALGRLSSNPNLAMLANAVVLKETEPSTMNQCMIFDNREGDKGRRPFDEVLRILAKSYWAGNSRTLGEMPFYVANTKDALEGYLKEAQTIAQSRPRITPINLEGDTPESAVKLVDDKGKIFTVFIAGGHNNNNKRDLGDADALGYFCAQQGWRIVTGAGVAEGSMGAVHTGFIRYRLEVIDKAIDVYRGKKPSGKISPGMWKDIERLQGALRLIPDKSDSPGEISKASIKHKLATHEYNPEKIILELPPENGEHFLDLLADRGLIPREMFYGYSMKDMLKMESPRGTPPPAITFFDAGNLERRLYGLCAPGNKVFMPGYIGTYQELDYAIKQHIENAEAANDGGHFADGTPFKVGDKAGGSIIIYNLNNCFGDLLESYGLAAPAKDTQAVRAAKALREKYNIMVIDHGIGEVRNALGNVAQTWQQAVVSEKMADKSPAAGRQA